MIKVHLNKHGNIEKIELPSGEVEQRHYGNMPNMLVLEEYEGSQFEMYDHKGVVQFEATLIEALKNTITWEVTQRYVEVDE